MKIKAIFLDRDGTIIIDHGYMSSPSQIEYFPWTKNALEIIQNKGFETFIITNQSGIGRKMFTIEDVESMHKKIQSDLILWGLRPFKEFAICPHAPSDNCICRKPSPYLIDNLINKYSIDRAQSYMVGDKKSDKESGINAGINGVELTKTYNLLDFANSL